MQYGVSGSGSFSNGPQNETGSTATISGLTANTSYEVQVRASNDEGDGPWSASLTASTLTSGLPEISIAAKSGGETIIEGTDSAAVFTLTRTGLTTEALTVDVSVTQQGEYIDGTAPVDATFTSGNATVELSVTIDDDSNDESHGSITVTLSTSNDYGVSATAGSATVTVEDEDGASLPDLPSSEEEVWTAVATNLQTDQSDDTLIGASGTSITPDSFRHNEIDYDIPAIYNRASANQLLIGVNPFPDAATVSDWHVYVADDIKVDFANATKVTISSVDYFQWVDVALSAANTPFVVGHSVNVRISQAITVPAAPSNLVAEAGDTEIVLTWNTPAEADNVTGHEYQVKSGTTTFGEWTAIDDSAFGGTNQAGFTMTGLTNDQLYTYKVRAVNAGGNSETSNEASATPTTVTATNNPPIFASGLATTVGIAENTAAAVNIGDPFTATDSDSGDTLTYTLEGAGSTVFAIASDGQLQTKEPLNHESTASYALTINVSDGTDSVTHSVTVTVTDVDEQPIAPAAPTFGSSTDTSLVVNWTAPVNTGKPDIASYDLRYRIETSTETPHSDGPQDVTTTSATITGLEENTTYEVQVRATNDEGDSPWSSNLLADTIKRPNQDPEFASDAPTTLEIAENSARDTNIGSPFTATDADGDMISYSVHSDHEEDFTIDGLGQLKTRRNLDYESKTTYFVTIEAVDDSSTEGSTKHDLIVNVADVDEPPEVPAAPREVSTTSTTIEVAWTRTEHRRQTRHHRVRRAVSSRQFRGLHSPYIHRHRHHHDDFGSRAEHGSRSSDQRHQRRRHEWLVSVSHLDDRCSGQQPTSL